MSDSPDQRAPEPDARADAEPAPRAAVGVLAGLDAWMAANPWHPRLVPFLVYVLWLPVIHGVGAWWLPIYPLLHVVQIAMVAWLLWRYRALLPELTLRFHWLAVPVGVALFAAWIALGQAMIALSPTWFGPGEEPHALERLSGGWLDATLAVRFAGMVMLVPLFEELFIRSACLRGLHSPRKTGIALLQLGTDLPVLGEWFGETRLGRRVDRYPAMFTRQLREWPVGRLSAFGVFASTLVFAAHHVPRDWAGCVVCGLAWCALLWWTNRGPRRLGLGPVVWSHAITNALLWAWVVSTGEWRFL